MQRLNEAILNLNSLKGSVPKAAGPLKALREVHVAQNSISGHISPLPDLLVLAFWATFGAGDSLINLVRCCLSNLRAGKKNKLKPLPKMALLGPRFWPKNPPEKVYVGPFFAFFPRN